jgi:PQQ-like domain
MKRLAVLACALALVAGCGDGGDRRNPPPEEPTPPATEPPSSDPQPSPSNPEPPSTQPTPGRVVSPPVTTDGVPVPAPGCALALSADPPDVAQAAEQPIALAWEYVAPEGWSVRFEGIQDPVGNLYWTEHAVDGGAGAFVASATRDGALRWRVAAPRAEPRALLVAAGRLVLTGAPSALGSDHPARIDALDAATGAVAWTVDVAAEAAILVPGDRGPAREGVRMDRPSVLGAMLTFPLSAVDQPGYVWPGLLRVDAASGAARELRQIAAGETIWIPGEPAASADTTFVTVSPRHQSRVLLGFDGSGAPRVVVPEPFDDGLWLEAVSDRWVFQSGQSGGAGIWGSGFLQWSALDGTPRGRVAGASGPTLVTAGDALFFAAEGRAARVDLAGCAIAWERTLARSPPKSRDSFDGVAEAFPTLTATGGVLLSHQRFTSQDGTSAGIEPGPGFVVELGPDGAERFRARLPDGLLRGGGAALHRGRWFVAASRPVWQTRLQAFDVGDREPAAAGWVTRHGSPSRERRAR